MKVASGSISRWGRIASLGLVVAMLLVLVGTGPRSQAAPMYTPRISDIAPVAGTTVNGPSVRIGATIRSDSGSPITAWTVTIDGQGYRMIDPVVSADSQQVLLYNYVNLSSGQHELYVLGTDAAGVQGGYRWTFTVAGGSPPTPPPGPLPNFTNLNPANNAAINRSNYRVQATISSNSGIVGEYFSLDGNYFPLSGISGGNSETVYYDFTQLSEGQHTAYLQAGDRNGNTNSVSWSFTVQYCPQGWVLVPETQRCVSIGFFQYWRANGGLFIFGYPISDEFPERIGNTTYSVQYFERARFEYHPELPEGQRVVLGLVGMELGTNEPRVQPANGKRYFNESGHGVPDVFLNYWLNTNGLALFGFPISEPRNEVSPTDGKTYAVQYFERARMEYHPELPAGQQVLLGLLGKQLYQQKYPGRPLSST